MNNNYLILPFILIFLIACKKDKLKDEKSIFIGKWEWNYSSHSYGYCQNLACNEILTPQTENTTYSIEFLKKGKVNFYKNNVIVGTYRVVFTHFEVDISNSTSYVFGIHLDNNVEKEFWGWITPNSLIFKSKNEVTFPFKYEYGCENYLNYFIKQ